MEGAVYLGLILLVGGAVLEWASPEPEEAEPRRAREDASRLRALLENRRFTRTSRLLQALGTVLLAIGVLALML